MLSAFCLCYLCIFICLVFPEILILPKSAQQNKLWAGEVFICIRNLLSFLEALSFSSPEDQSVIGGSGLLSQG